MKRTLFEKIWQNHLVKAGNGVPAILYIDLHLIHEVTSPQAFEVLRQNKLTVRRPHQTLATIDHSIPTSPPGSALEDELAAAQIARMQTNSRDFGIPLHGIEVKNRGIVHVIGPELGLTQPGMTIVCGDSHTATHGAFGALAFGIGTSEVSHVLATQTLLQNKPRTMKVEITGSLPRGVGAKDIILALIGKIGINGGTGYVIEYSGSAVRSLDMEGRMTLCNMSIEAGARAGMVAPDDVTFDYLSKRPAAPTGRQWQEALQQWRQLCSDPGASCDTRVEMDVASLPPMITFGTTPAQVIGVDGVIPDPDAVVHVNRKAALQKALAYMDFKPGQPIRGKRIDVVFIGSCTNGRLSDLRAAAEVIKGRKVADHVRALVVPGSNRVKKEAEAEGLDQIFLEAGAEWRYPGCSMCIAMNGDELRAGQYAVSTSNRNFEGRQGKGGRTLLAGPMTAAACAVTGTIADVREFMRK
ncbi:3-isopropylmalate dehydratase large subunit [candidate division KSB1 bacterium]|nr:3-isopropylmalate dehydratase large subunit [candidate division KSB1 bacterium]